jgi:hypothetical protein
MEDSHNSERRPPQHFLPFALKKQGDKVEVTNFDFRHRRFCTQLPMRSLEVEALVGGLSLC